MPVVRASSADEAMQVIEAIKAGGVNVLEITMTVPGAVKVIESRGQIRQRSSCRSRNRARSRNRSGMSACGSSVHCQPGTQSRHDRNLSPIQCPHRSGSLTPTEVITAWSAGADFVKVFPCGSVGGASYIKNLHGPFPQVKMIPTGGVSLKTAADFIKAGARLSASVLTLSMSKPFEPATPTSSLNGRGSS